MVKIIKGEGVDLRTFPKATSAPADHVTLGDLHGNALKLIFSLIKEGVIKITPEDYKKVAELYQKDTEKITKADIEKYQTILRSIEVSTKTAVTLIGDELADRGKNDYFTLLVLKKLKDAGVDFDVTISNHSAEFIRDFDRPKFTGAHGLCSDWIQDQGASLTGMMKLIDEKLISDIEIRSIVKDVYIPATKAIGYTIAEDGSLSIFSHAPIGLDTVKALAEKFQIEYKENTREELIATIDSINIKVREAFSNKQLTELITNEQKSSINPKGYQPGTEGDIPITHNSPLNRLIWNRVIETDLKTQPDHKAFSVKFIHGHVSEKTTAPHSDLQNLDNSLGKGEHYTGEYVSRHSDEKTQLQQKSQKTSSTTPSPQGSSESFPRVSAVLNNCLLNCSLPAIGEHVSLLAKGEQEASEGFELLKKTFSNFYGIKPDVTWKVFDELMKKTKPYDLQMIMGPVLRDFMSKNGAGAELTNIETTRYPNLQSNQGADYLYKPLGLELSVQQMDPGGKVNSKLSNGDDILADAFSTTGDIVVTGNVMVYLVNDHFELDPKYFSTEYTISNSSPVTEMTEIAGKIGDVSTKEKAERGIEALKAHVKDKLIPALSVSTPATPKPQKEQVKKSVHFPDDPTPPLVTTKALKPIQYDSILSFVKTKEHPEFRISANDDKPYFTLSFPEILNSTMNESLNKYKYSDSDLMFQAQDGKSINLSKDLVRSNEGVIKSLIEKGIKDNKQSIIEKFIKSLKYEQTRYQSSDARKKSQPLQKMANQVSDQIIILETIKSTSSFNKPEKILKAIKMSSYIIDMSNEVIENFRTQEQEHSRSQKVTPPPSMGFDDDDILYLPRGMRIPNDAPPPAHLQEKEVKV